MSSYMKLVIADDEPNIRDSLSQLFPWEELGIQVVFLAANGREVLDYMEMNPVDLLLADIRMPVMDGLELTQVVRQTYPEVPVILLSAFADFEYARTALRFGVSAYLTKPVNYGELMKTFRTVAHSAIPPESAPGPAPETTGDGQPVSYKGYYNEIVTRIQEYVRDNADTASLIGTAELTGLSASYVSTIFHRCLNQTFSDYLNQTRMEKAMQLLKEGRSVSDTAWMVGYNNPRNFSRVFKQYHGVDPCPAKR